MRRLPRLIPFIITFLLVALALSNSAPVLAATPLILPTGFVDEPVFPSGNELLAPRAFTFTPDGRILALERGSAASDDINFASIRVIKNSNLLPTRAYTLNTCGDAERGALGIVADPDFVNNGYIYVYYTRQTSGGSSSTCAYNTFTGGDPLGPRNRISRLTMSGDIVTPGSEVVLVDSIITDVGYHNAGDLHFGLDGYLYASAGEGGLSWTSPDTGTLNGKIIRILPDSSPRGYSTTGNPYDTDLNARYCGASVVGTQNNLPGPCREIFAKGFRNPFRFTIQPNMPGIPGTGSPFVGDVGGGVWEEVDQVQSGGDYGHPVREGYCSAGVLCSPPYSNGGYINPVYAYPHSTIYANSDSAIIGGDFYIGTAGYPAAYVNNYFFSDFTRGFIGRLYYSGGQWLRAAQNFATGGKGIVGLKRGPDGNLYYLAFTSDTLRLDAIRRIRYTGSSNQRPTAQISVSPLSGSLNTVYTFSAVGSTDPENNVPFSYFWDFGDGITATTTTPTITHTYASATNEIASVTVTDHGVPAMNSAPATITVYPGNTAPSGTMVLTNTTDNIRSQNFTFYAGDTWTFAATNVTDDVMAPPPVVTWEIVFHHQNHTHPFIPLVEGNSGQFTLPNTGELDPVIWYRIHLYLTDSRGQRTEFTQDIIPVTRVVKFDSVPGGGKVTIEGATFTTPLSLTRVVGMHFAATVPSPQTIAGVSYSFQSWSQGGNQQQTMTVPAVDTTYMVNFTPPRNYFTTHTPTLTWNQVTGTVNYDVQIGTNSSYTGATINSVGNVLSFTPSTPLSSGEYFWRVRACSAVATCGAWSTSDIFIVDAP